MFFNSYVTEQKLYGLLHKRKGLYIWILINTLIRTGAQLVEIMQTNGVSYLNIITWHRVAWIRINALFDKVPNVDKALLQNRSMYTYF